jgi:transcriptional accessory protein Tex/SPT6
LVHISQMSDKFISHPSEALKVQQKVQVTVLEVDTARKRISLSMKTDVSGMMKTPAKPAERRERERERSKENTTPKPEFKKQENVKSNTLKPEFKKTEFKKQEPKKQEAPLKDMKITFKNDKKKGKTEDEEEDMMAKLEKLKALFGK